MYQRPYPLWEDPEIDEWRENYPDEYAPRCFPIIAIGTIGIVGAVALCRPRQGCYPYGCYPYRCYPYRSCTPTHICYPRRACLPTAG
ncbi:hypothetical protein [Anaeroselena agilis]|uniref:Uncharacterized protein n=1 Tax=Anaeroselena agilis TaxID=3063788 RepID=A0ABU3NWF5_9FIRM|nr:hypothetical protein [Selenomonadales bacterium 4137-cl]